MSQLKKLIGSAAIMCTGQGFSNLDESPEVLNTQRMWWDLENPEFGEGE